MSLNIMLSSKIGLFSDEGYRTQHPVLRRKQSAYGAYTTLKTMKWSVASPINF